MTSTTPTGLRAISHLAFLAVVALAAAPVRADERAPRVWPAAVTLDGGLSYQQLIVLEPSADGARFDRTATARYEVVPPGLASVDSTGLIRPAEAGTGTIRVERNGRTVEIPLEVRDPARFPVASYRHDVVPILSRAGCNMGACHGNFNGKGGLRLSLRGQDPAGDYQALTRQTLARRVDPFEPTASLAYRKAAGLVPHEGGKRFAADSAEAAALLRWIAAGAADDPQAPEVVRLTVEPRVARIEAASGGQQLAVMAEFADGTRRDVTRQAAFDPSDPTRFEVTREGRVVASGPGEVAIGVRFLNGRAVSRLAFVPESAGYAWRAPASANHVDELAFARLKDLRIQPAVVCDDSTYLRRVYLDTLGVLPTPDETRGFLEDDRPDKRSRLVDGLLDRPEFADYWALKWADLLRNEEKTMGPKGVWAFQRWLRDQIAADVPLDQLARSLLTAEGSTWANPAASIYRTNRDPDTTAETVGQVFLGQRFQCARCHNHPFEAITQDDYYGLAAYFGNIERKRPNDSRSDRLDKHEINGDEIIYIAGQPRVKHPQTGGWTVPKPPGAAAPELGGDPDARDDFADWLTRDNRQFARNMANRVWFHLMGRGLVDPVDDFRDSNPPHHPELLERLTDDLIASGMRLRPLVRLILNSNLYQLDSQADASLGEPDPAQFAVATVKLLPAEVLLDAIGQALDHRIGLKQSPEGLRAVQFPGVSSGEEFLKVFGKPERLLTCECERSEATTLAQAFQLINGSAVRESLEAKDNRLGRLLKSDKPPPAILEELYLAALCRFPSEIESDAALAHLEGAANPRAAWEDIAWAIVNSKEFLLRH